MRGPRGSYVRVLVLLAGFALLGVATLPAGSAVMPQYIINCTYTGQTQAIDPLVAPGVEPSAHLHDFVGAPGVTSTTTPSDLVGKGTTSCNNQNGFVKPDGSANWVPTLYLDGAAVHPTKVNLYYRCQPFCGRVLPLPAGTEFVAGSAQATSDQPLSIVKWDCGANNSTTTPYATAPHDCTQYAPGSGGVDGLTAVVIFPQCWDGSGLATADFAYPSGSTCPAGFATPVERVEQHVHYGLWSASPSNVALSSGPYYTMHADYMDGWTEPAHASIVRTCLNSGSTCS